MKKKLLVGLSIWLFLIGMIGIAIADPIITPFLSFSPPTSSIEVGDSIDIDLVVSDLGGSYFSEFSFTVKYDSSILSFNGYIIDSTDDVNTTISSGYINITDYSPDMALQDGISHTLATLSFSGLAQGSSDLDFLSHTICDQGGSWFQGTTIQNGSISVTEATSPVPEPTTMILFGLGLLGLAGVNRRKQ